MRTLIAISLLILLAAVACGTETPEPVATTEPTATVASSLPTNTPAPIQLPCPTQAEAAYFAELSRISSPTAEALLSFGELNSKAGLSPALLFDDEWTLDVALQITILNLAAEELQVMEAPASVQAIHNDMLEWARLTKESNDLYVKGIDDLDMASINLSIAKLIEATGFTVAATEKTEALCQ